MLCTRLRRTVSPLHNMTLVREGRPFPHMIQGLEKPQDRHKLRLTKHRRLSHHSSWPSPAFDPFPSHSPTLSPQDVSGSLREPICSRDERPCNLRVLGIRANIGPFEFETLHSLQMINVLEDPL